MFSLSSCDISIFCLSLVILDVLAFPKFSVTFLVFSFLCFDVKIFCLSMFSHGPELGFSSSLALVVLQAWHRKNFDVSYPYC